MAFGFDDAAMAGLGAINSGVQIYGQQVQNRGKKKLLGIQREGEQRDYANEGKGIGLQQEDVNRQATLAQQGSREGDYDRGMGPSGERQYDWNQIEGGRSRRYDALQREKNELDADWNDKQRSYKIQKKMEKSQQMMGLISGFLMQGASGVKDMKSGARPDANGERHAF